MDASIAIEREACCDGCGYPRRGLSADARCPECGEPPPILAAPAITFQTSPRTQNELLWLRSITIGLAIFLVYSFYALQVTLIMPVGSFALAAMNFPGPKLNATTPIQRAIGGQPGEWGVAGSMATLLEVAGIWLMTQRRAVRGDREFAITLRSSARWISILAAGGLLGLALSGFGDFIAPMSNECGGILICAILLAELPANLLIYLYLHKLANELQSRRAAQILSHCIWIVPGLTLAAAGLIGADMYRGEAPPAAWHLVTAAYGAITVATSAAATAAVVLLLATTGAAGFGGWVGNLRLSLRRWRQVPPRLPAITTWIDRHASRGCVVIGLVLWLWMLPTVAQNALWRPGRTGMLGDIPMFGFIGPKVAAPLAIESEYSHVEPEGESAFVGLMVVWLITVRPTADEPRGRRILRLAARWVAIYAIGAPVGIRMALWSEERERSFLLAVGVIACEIPATTLLYLYLSTLARALKGPALTLRCMVFAAPVVAGLPSLAFVLHRYFKIDPHDMTLTAAASIAIAGSLAVTLIGASAVLRLAWAIARNSLQASDKLTVPPMATVHRSIAPDALPANRFA